MSLLTLFPQAIQAFFRLRPLSMPFFLLRLTDCPLLYVSYLMKHTLSFESDVTQSCPTLCDPMDCSLPGSSVHGIFQAKILEWVSISFSREFSWPRDWTRVSCIVGRRFTVWATREAPTPTLSFRSQLNYFLREGFLWSFYNLLFFLITHCIFSFLTQNPFCNYIFMCFILFMFVLSFIICSIRGKILPTLFTIVYSWSNTNTFAQSLA